jgi:hypothetical protein
MGGYSSPASLCMHAIAVQYLEPGQFHVAFWSCCLCGQDSDHGADDNRVTADMRASIEAYMCIVHN